MSIERVQPTYRFVTEFSIEPFDHQNADDFRIRVAEVHPEGPVVVIFKYESGVPVPVCDEMLSYFIVKRLITLNHEFEVGQEFHVKISFQDQLH